MCLKLCILFSPPDQGCNWSVICGTTFVQTTYVSLSLYLHFMLWSLISPKIPLIYSPIFPHLNSLLHSSFFTHSDLYDMFLCPPCTIIALDPSIIKISQFTFLIMNIKFIFIIIKLQIINPRLRFHHHSLSSIIHHHRLN